MNSLVKCSNYSATSTNDVGTSENDFSTNANSSGTNTNDYSSSASDSGASLYGSDSDLDAATPWHATNDTWFLGFDSFVGGKKQTVDYHGMFDNNYFVKWFVRLLDELRSLGKENAVVVMDNTAYHKVLPEDAPKGYWTKVRIIEACKKYKLPVNEKELRPVIWARLKAYILANVLPVVVSLAHERGHEVVYTPPYHSDLQPIEMVWAYTKGRVGRQYCNNTTFQDVKDRLAHEFATLPDKIIRDCVNHMNKKVRPCLPTSTPPMLQTKPPATTLSWTRKMRTT
ncbi:hypothetical protein ACHHYP_11603 [Achlya hypogyna]|uniref:Uncharacterized protein n=1 Tax=Achlya hypogyna TaxID=1202772 RepID=A0A1V9YIW2_ACHHY|nr:hypothetical protein ACHHYP_11603 [Achlya hypogyna]